MLCVDRAHYECIKALMKSLYYTALMYCVIRWFYLLSGSVSTFITYSSTPPARLSHSREKLGHFALNHAHPAPHSTTAATKNTEVNKKTP